MTRRLALWAGLLAMMAAGSAAPGLRTMETEEVDGASSRRWRWLAPRVTQRQRRHG